ncbi:TPA: DUF3560 domain-containing protein [Proteus mirabilis]|uniref:DUF3560 domain-containing protein n=1 Tax=Proteus terrae subsp. cibarius TaxID=626774 RepID=A0ABX6JT05_9GAMM|nr:MULTISPECIES: DUF3560 domain-containing protein [Proteus]MBU5964444.1 DUF3560 domain-containing protein [Proteus mirabilis]QHD96441.1 DUF3560 domain-containing protein [Proteus terrae subsp. cibarius]QIF92318.1 DUF3560 domain-containing protein [Proteus terrae subsp. cibarius]QJW53111.1 DUF3560 domain-containing protein [Proteus terrae subsp. cibarius]
MTKQEIAIEALQRAENNASEANYDVIFDGFIAMGIAEKDIEPRVNVFTFNAWKAKGRFVKKGEKGVKVITYILVDKKQKDSEETKKIKVKRQTTVFHISQTSPLDEPTEPKDKTPLIESENIEKNVKDEQEQPTTTELTKKPLNWYEEKQARRKERYQALADNAVMKSNAIYSQARNMADMIPFGQPILLGHHSEKRDRNFRGKITRTFEKSFEQSNKAEYYERKAKSVGKAGISSDDPDAILKLEKKLSGLKKSQETMKLVNKIVRKKTISHDEKLLKIMELGLKKETANELLTGDFMGRLGFASYALQNNNAEINRIEKRINSLSKHKENENIVEENETFTFKLDYEINRIMFIFEGKPESSVREILKSNAFHWSKFNKAWVRKITPNALYIAKLVKENINEVLR